mgnify:FL=1
MSDWPPKPQEENQKIQQQPTGEEWKLLEKVILVSVDEQRKARRWGIFFKFLTFGYIFLLLVIMGKGCSTNTVRR